MTVVIGLKCSQGIILGSDGAATLGSMGLRTIVQPTTKLSLIENKAIFGFSGQVGLSQLFYDRAWTGHVMYAKPYRKNLASLTFAEPYEVAFSLTPTYVSK